MPRAHSLVVALLLAHASPAYPANQHVEFATTLGSFIVELCGEESPQCTGAAPKTVAHFLRLVDEDYYPATTIIDRRDPGPTLSVLQGGALYSGTDTMGDFVDFLEPLHVIKFESATHLSNLRGSIGAIYEIEVAGSAGWWYINLTDNPSFDVGSVVFGQIVAGMNVVDAIAAVPIYPDYLLGNLPLIDYPGAPASVVPHLVHVTSTERVPEPSAAALALAALAPLAWLARRP